ncbi:MAG: response regulator [Xanthomonadales bacterium]|nr:response regulator [Xanthomonadales bacterium]MCC6562492.1 response regulator [Xanthomonadales bacterium]
MNASTARILVIDDDAVFADVLARSLQRRGPIALAANSLAGALASGAEFRPTHIVLDLKLGADDGLLALPELLARWPQARVLLLTGYASIATAVAAIKRGAHDYLAKPADAAQVLRALGLVDADASAEAASPERPLAWNRVAWEHIQRVLQEQGGNVAATARALGMHRRTLQRILRKHAPTA